MKMDEPVILNLSDDIYFASRMQAIVAKYMGASKINKHISPHSFRRTLCSLLLKSGLNLKVIASIVGHLKLSTTAKYTELDVDTLTQVYRFGHPRA